MDATDEGIQIDESDEQPEKAPGSICESSEFGSNATIESLRQRQKQS
jgi:hypothetical protein